METLNSVFAWLLRTSWQTSVLIALVLVAQWLFRKKLSAGWRYSLWLLVVMRLVMPAAPSSVVSIFNVARFDSAPSLDATMQPFSDLTPSPVVELPPTSESKTVSPPTSAQTTTERAITTTPPVASPLPPPSHAPRTTHHAFRNWLPLLWLSGVLVLLAHACWQNIRFAFFIRRLRPVTDTAVLELLEDCKELIRLRTPLTVLETSAVTTPALYGFVRPKLLLPPGVLDALTPEELRHVFLHELAHVKRCDMPLNWLVSALRMLHWFNPIVWFGFRRLAVDRELAADALALSRSQSADGQAYGQTILKLLESLARPAAMPGVIGILEDKQQMKERITMIAQFRKKSGWPILAAMLVATLAMGCLTDAKSSRRTADRFAATGQLLIQKIVPSKSEHWDRFVAYGDSHPSPDGRYFGYVNWTHGNLAVCDARTGEVRDLTTDATWEGPDVFTWGAIWSPDSRQIAYFWQNGHEGDLRVIDRNGGPPRILVSREKGGSIAPHAWSKDGRFIIGRAPIKKWQEGERAITRIVRVEVANGAITVVKELSGETIYSQARLSPDGKYFAFATQEARKGAEPPPGRIRVVSMDGSTDRILIDHPADSFAPHWMPDGRHLIFLSNRSGETGLWIVPVKEGQAIGEPRLVRNGLGRTSLLGVTDDGTVYHTAETPRMNIFVADVDFDAGTMQPPKLVSLRHDGGNKNPRWSADGSQLAYMSIRSAGWPPSGALVFQDVATGKERDVESRALNFYHPPFWAPDLSKLIGTAMVPARRGDGTALWLVDAKTGQRSIFVDKSADSGNFTADGKFLIYVENFYQDQTLNGGAIIERDLGSGQERVIAKREGFNLGSSLHHLSPDGSRLAAFHQRYSPFTEETARLVITSRANGAAKTVWEPARDDAAILDWLPDNRRVLVSVEDKQGTQQLRVIDIETGRDKPFGPALRRYDQIERLSIHPDGKRIAFSRGGDIQELWTMRNIVPRTEVAAR